MPGFKPGNSSEVEKSSQAGAVLHLATAWLYILSQLQTLDVQINLHVWVNEDVSPILGVGHKAVLCLCAARTEKSSSVMGSTRLTILTAQPFKRPRLSQERCL